MTGVRGSDVGPTVLSQDIYEVSSVQKYRLGTRIVQGDRSFRYSKAGEDLTTNYYLIQGLVNDYKPYEGNRPSTAYPVGATEITITALSTGNAVTYGTKDMFAGGYIWFQQATHQMHKIRSNTASAGGNIVLTLEWPLLVALPSSASGGDTMWVTMWPNIYGNVKHASGGMRSVVCSILTFADDGEYFWGQTWGPKFFQAGGTTPGKTANYRECFFQADGSVVDRSIGTEAWGQQRAGYILSQTTSSDGDQLVMLQLTP